MALDRLVDEIEARAREEIAKERARLDTEKTRLIGDRDERIREIDQDAERRATELGARERIRVVASARLRAKRLEHEAREAAAVALLGTVREELTGFTKESEYPKLVRRMFRFASDRLGSGLRVRGRAEDAKLLRSVAGSGYLDDPLPILGGFVAETPDGRRLLNLSFDELLRLREDAVRAGLPS